MRCDECKHWSPDPAHDWEDNGAGVRKCMAIEERWEVADRASDHIDNLDRNDEWIDVRRKAIQDAKAVVVDGSQYRAELLTTADFFCAKFEQK